jgi:hypothetical protein
MKTFTLAAVLCVLAGSVYAQSPTCKVQAGEKKLAGAALNSFMTKCEKDAKADCDKQAAEKKLSGAAKTSFTTKCEKDAVGQ